MDQPASFFRARVVATLAACAAAMIAASVALGQVQAQREVIYRSEIPAPMSVTAAELVEPTSPLETRAAIAQSKGHIRDAVAGANAELPLVPWDEFGLSHTQLSMDAIRFDEARGRYVADLADGRTAILTLNRRMQERLTGILARFDEPGEAIVAIDPSTGRVLALADGASDPAIGPGLARHAYAYAASTFKVITAAALLEQGETTIASETCFSGGGDGFNESDLDFNPATDTQCLTLGGAMAWSANLYFGRRAIQYLTAESLQQKAEAFGFNTRIPFELEIERSTAAIPTDSLGLALAAAGFHHTQMSAFHGALIQAAIANGGVMMVPTLIETIEGSDGTTVYTHSPFAWRTPISPEVAEALTASMEDTCVSGTARADFGQRDGWPASIRVWGKTGTLSNRPPGATSDPDPAYIYRWFTGFGRSDGESVAVGGLVVNTPEWWIKGTYLGSEATLARFQ